MLQSHSAQVLGPEAAMAGILQLLQQMGGINFEEYKPGTVMRRIERRIAVRQVGGIESYLALLHQDRAEVLTLRRELLIPVTSFFRDTESFEALNRQVIDPIVSSKDAGQPIRVWCAGVATGEEAYSVAMLFLEAFDQAKRWPSLKIFATDVEQLNVETAAAGTYPESIVAEISSQQLERFFVKKGSQFVVKNELRQSIVFARHNILSDPPFTKMDLVVCRNVLIYFRNAAQDRALRRMQYALNPRGFLFLGSSESLGDLQRDFHTLSARHKIWQVVRPTSLPLDLGKSALQNTMLISPARRSALSGSGGPHGPGAVDQGYAALLREFAPPGGHSGGRRPRADSLLRRSPSVPAHPRRPGQPRHQPHPARQPHPRGRSHAVQVGTREHQRQLRHRARGAAPRTR
jgi:two-component system CheB/CheR fusion protein